MTGQSAAKPQPVHCEGRRVLIISRHDYRTRRRASVHFVARHMAQQGHQVTFMSIGYSWLSRLRGDSRADLFDRANAWEQVDGLQAYLQSRGWNQVTRPQSMVMVNVVLGVHKPSGELAWLNVRADPLREPDDPALRGVVATFTDVTAERTAPEGLEFQLATGLVVQALLHRFDAVADRMVGIDAVRDANGALVEFGKSRCGCRSGKSKRCENGAKHGRFPPGLVLLANIARAR